MVKISDAQRIIKRIMFSNVVSDKKDLSLTPLISGRHGIGKSMLVRKLASDLNGSYMTVEGGSLKEGEITGLPYQYMDKDGKISFRFLPYYIVDRIQNKEKEIFLARHNESEVDELLGRDNRYSDNDISADEKIKLLKDGSIKPVIVFFDEINRTDSQVYKELMNILLTRQVNGYTFPWWVFFVAAMNPCSKDSLYATNEMDPAQLDRFIKIDVKASSNDWLNYAKDNSLSPIICSYVKENRSDLIGDDNNSVDDLASTPSPRGYDMLDTIISSLDKIKVFFDKKETEIKVVQADLRVIFRAKLGDEVGERFYQYYIKQANSVSFASFINDDEKLSSTLEMIKNLSIADKSKLGLEIIHYMMDFSSTLSSNTRLLVSLQKKIALYLKCMELKNQIEFAYDFSSSLTRKGEKFQTVYRDIYYQQIEPLFNKEKLIKDMFR